MFSAFVPTRKRSASIVNPPDDVFSKKQKVQHQEQDNAPDPAFDNGAWETLPNAQPYGVAPNSTLAAGSESAQKLNFVHVVCAMSTSERRFVEMQGADVAVDPM